MIKFATTIKQFGQQAEKTGWTYIEIPAAKAKKLNPGVKKTFRVKGKLDDYVLKQTAILPMGNGDFILPLNLTMRKAIKKMKGATVMAQMEVDETPLQLSSEFMECLVDEPRALKHFNTLAKSHQAYFSKWIESAKTEETKAKRIAVSVNALAKRWGYGEMIRAETQKRKDLLR
jgi:sugar phosphate isomerase/epimerase